MKKIIFYKTSAGNSPVEDFLDILDPKQAQKVSWTLRVIRDSQKLFSKYFEKLKNTDGISEVRIQSGNNIFRILGFYENPDKIILTNAFAKKTQKTPKREIELAEQRKKEYQKRRNSNG